MNTHEDEDLDILLSLQDTVPETPPGSPSNSLGCLSDDESPRRNGPADLSAFKSVVEDCLQNEPKPVVPCKASKANKSKGTADDNIERFSGLRIRNQVLSPAEINDRFSDIRFVRLPTIKNILKGDSLSGCWVTVGILTEKGDPKTSSIGQNYCIWKIGCLDENTISLFLFGDAYQKNYKEQAGTVFAFFNCAVKKDSMGGGFSLSVQSSNQTLKMGISADFGVCNGKKKDGLACTAAINKRKGTYCRYHMSVRTTIQKASEKFTTTRTELKGGNLRTGIWNPLVSGVYMVDPGRNSKKSSQPMKVLSVEALKKALSKAGKVTPNAHSQGIRFLTEMTGQKDDTTKGSLKVYSSEKRKSTCLKVDPTQDLRKHLADMKRRKNDKGQGSSGESKQVGKKNDNASSVESKQVGKKNDNASSVESRQVGKKNDSGQSSTVESKQAGKMIELDFVSSDDEM
ncbi:hypothetical protein ACFE04_030196 [Oxalis oulophora]